MKHNQFLQNIIETQNERNRREQERIVGRVEKALQEARRLAVDVVELDRLPAAYRQRVQERGITLYEKK